MRSLIIPQINISSWKGRQRLALVVGVLLVCFCGVKFKAAAQGAWQAKVIALSQDARFVAASFKPNLAGNRYRAADGGIWLYDLEDLLAPALHLMESRYADIELVFSPDNAYLAVIDFDGLYVFRTADGGLVFQLQHPITHWIDQAHDTVEFSPDSQYLRTFNIFHPGGPGEDRGLFIPIWDFKRSQLATNAMTQVTDSFTKVWLSPDWTQIVVFEKIFDFDIETGMGRPIGVLDFPGYSGLGGHQGDLFREDGARFATTTHDCIVQIYETTNWTVTTSWD